MYRNVILEFLCTNNKILLENKYSQMTLVLFPNEYQNLLKLYKDSSLIKVYHVKEQYTFYKEIELSKLENSIVEMVIEQQELININFSDISFEINDPYYLKDIREQKFLSLELNPIFEDNKLVGILLLYSKSLNAKFNISNKKLLTFINKLYSDEENTMKEIVVNSIINNENWHYVVKKDKNYYLNEKMVKDRRFNTNIITDKDRDIIRLKKHLSVMKKINNENFEIYYIPANLTKVNTQNVEMYLLDSINSHNFVNDYTVIFTKDLESICNSYELASKFKNAILKIYPEANIKFYQVDKDALAIIADQTFTKKDENELKYILKKTYYLLLNKTNGLTKGLDLIKIITYLNNNLPNSFNYNEYSEYLNKHNKELLDCDKSINHYCKIMIKADTLQTIGEVVNAPINNYFNMSIYKLHENELINLLERIINEKIENPIVNMCINSFNKRKIYELLKKLIIICPNSKLIFHAPKIINHYPTNLYETILKAKELGYVVVVDSTIFMDLKYNICLKVSDAVIIRKDELNESLTEYNIFNKKIFESFYEDSKVVIFEELPKEEDLCIINELTCLFVDK